MVPVWKMSDENIPDDVKERALEKMREDAGEWACDRINDDEYLTCVDCLSGCPTAWDLDRGQYIQFEFDLNDESVRQWLKIPKSVWDKADVEIENIEYYNTTIRFMCDGEDLLKIDAPDRRWNLKPFIETEFSEEGENRIYYWDLEIMKKAKEKFDKAMDKAFENMEKSYEYEMSYENLEELAIINDYEFDNDGNMV